MVKLHDNNISQGSAGVARSVEGTPAAIKPVSSAKKTASQHTVVTVAVAEEVVPSASALILGERRRAARLAGRKILMLWLTRQQKDAVLEFLITGGIEWDLPSVAEARRILRPVDDHPQVGSEDTAIPDRSVDNEGNSASANTPIESQRLGFLDTEGAVKKAGVARRNRKLDRVFSDDEISAYEVLLRDEFAGKNLEEKSNQKATK